MLAAFALSSIFQAGPARGQRRALVLESGLSKGGLRLQLSAERLSYRPARSCARGSCLATLSLQGKVSVVARDRVPGKAGRVRLSLRCPKLEISLDARGRLVSLRGSGGLTVAVGRLRGAAGGATLVGGKRLELTKARLASAELGLALSGDRIVVGLTSGELTVHRARADLASGSWRGGRE